MMEPISAEEFAAAVDLAEWRDKLLSAEDILFIFPSWERATRGMPPEWRRPRTVPNWVRQSIVILPVLADVERYIRRFREEGWKVEEEAGFPAEWRVLVVTKLFRNATFTEPSCSPSA